MEEWVKNLVDALNAHVKAGGRAFIEAGNETLRFDPETGEYVSERCTVSNEVWNPDP